MIRSFVSANRYATAFPNDRLHILVTRIAAGDRAAFRTLYAFLAMRVWYDAIRLLPPVDARAATRSTFVEVWHLAGHHLDQGGRGNRAWVQSILAGHVDDRIRAAGVRRPLSDGHDQHKQHELTALLGNGHATIRTAAATFMRVDDLAPVPPSSASGPGWLVPVR